MSGSRWNLIAFAVALLSNLISLPLAIGAIGLEHFGTAGLVIAGFVPMSVLGAVLGQGLTRELARPEVAGDPQAGLKLVTFAVAACLAGSVLVGVLAASLGPSMLARVRHDGLATSYAAVLAAGFAVWFFQQWCFLCQGILSGLQSFRAMALANAAGGVAGAVAVVIACRATGKDVGFLIGTAGGFALQAAMLTATIRRERPQLLRVSLSSVAPAPVLLRFFAAQGSAHLAGSIANQADRYILGATAPTAVVGQYNVAMRMQEVVHMGVLKMSEVLMPHFSATSSDAPEASAHFFLRVTWVVNVLSVAALAPLIPLAPALITSWIDEQAAEYGGTMLQTLATAGILGCGINVFTFFALGTGQAGRLALINIAHSVTLVVMAIPLILMFGPLAAGWGYVAGNLLRWTASIWYSMRHFEGLIGWRQLLLASASPIAVALAASWGLLPLTAQGIQGWPLLIAGYFGIGTLLAILATALAATSGEGRAWIRSIWALVSRNAPIRAQTD